MEHSSTSGPASPADERLDSWKEIAAYLRRSVRGVQRWEAEEGMPVRRHRHDKRGTVFAFKAELDAWWRERGTLLADENGAEAVALPSTEREPAIEIDTRGVLEATEAPAQERAATVPVSGRRATGFLLGTGFALAIGLVVLVAWLFRNGPGRAGQARSIPFQARDWVLVAGFENRTGEPSLEGVVDFALERELAESRHVNVVPRERVGDVLRLMSKTTDTRVDAALGREICVRDGGIRRLLTGRIEKVGSKYPLTVTVVDPGTGATVASIVEEAGGKDQLVRTIRRGSYRLRELLGEAPDLVRKNERKLPEVTTPSLLALRLYSQADELIAEGKNAAAEELLRQAVAEDPDFASAHIHLAFAIRNQNKPTDKFLPYAETAYRLSGRTSERERYFIRGGYFEMIGRMKEAAAAYEAVLSLYPDHYWASQNLTWLCRDLGRTNEFLKGLIRDAELRPKNFWSVHSAAWNLARFGQDPAQTRLYVGRARNLVSPEVLEQPFSWAVSWLELFPAYERWLAGDAAGALAIATRFAEKTRSTPSPNREVAFRSLGSFFLAVGRLKSAEDAFGHLSEPALSLGLVSLQRGDRQELRRLSLGLVARSHDVDPNIGFFLVRTGLGQSAQRVLEINERKPIEPGLLQALRGELAMARGRSEEAMDELKKSQESRDVFGKMSFFLGAETLASALAQHGNEEAAVRALESASLQGRPAIFLWMSNGGFWTRNQFLLARLYRKVGRVADAQRIEAELAKLLAVADSDHPIVVELKRLGAPTRAVLSAADPTIRSSSP